MLIERDVMISDTTWYSAAQVANFGMNQTMASLKLNSIRLCQGVCDDHHYPA